VSLVPVITHLIPPMVDIAVMLMQSSADTPLLLEDYASLDLVVLHHVELVVVSMQYSMDTSPMFWGYASLNFFVSPLVQPIVMSMQFLTDITPIFGGDASLDFVFSHPIQPMVDEVVISMQYLIDPTLLLESDKSKEEVAPMQFLVDPALLFLVLYLLCHVLSISSTSPSEQKRVLIFPISLPTSLDEVPFDWDGLVGYPMPSPMSFPGRDTIRYITEMITSIITLSSSTWTDLGLPKLMLFLRKILTFHKRSAQEPWHPP
jgi:hypothetical protein